MLGSVHSATARERDVAPKAGDLELSAARAVGQPEEPAAAPRTPEQNARDLATDFRTATPRPASGYQANWTGQIVVVRGTVAGVGDQPVDAPIRFKETPNLTVCLQYPNRLRRVYGADLNVLVGKAVEVTGEVVPSHRRTAERPRRSTSTKSSSSASKAPARADGLHAGLRQVLSAGADHRSLWRDRDRG